MSPAGVSSSNRTNIAKNPPTTKNKVIDTKYSSAMRLWSFVSSQEARLCPLFR